MKKIFIGIVTIVFIVIIAGCSANTDPQFRIRNEQSSKINIKIQTSDNKKIDINDIEPGKTTEYRKVPEGALVATSVTQNESVSFNAAKSTRYTVIVSTGKPPSMSIDL